MVFGRGSPDAECMSPASSATRAQSSAVVALSVLGGIQIVLGLFIAFAPGAFADTIGAFGARNDHLARDIATIYFALGAGLLVAVRRPSWRRPVLLVAIVQYGLHTVNHLADVADADPGWAGPFDVAILASTLLVIAWLWVAAAETTNVERDGP